MRRNRKPLGLVLEDDPSVAPVDLDVSPTDTGIPEVVSTSTDDQDDGGLITTSLIDGLELDGEPKAKKVENPADDDLSPTVVVHTEDEELQQMAALEAISDDIQYLIQDIVRTQGVSKQFALEAHRVAPEAISHPVSMYSELPSRTLYTLTLEELTVGIWKLIVAAALAAVLLIRKVYKYFRGEDFKATNNNRNLDRIEINEIGLKAAEKIMPAAKQTIVQTRQLLSRANVTLLDKNDREFHVTSFDQVLDKYFVGEDMPRIQGALEMLQSKNGYYHDIMNRGPYTTMILAVGASLGEMSTGFQLRCEQLDKIMERDIMSTKAVDEAINNVEIKAALEPLRFNVRGFNIRDASLQTIADELRQTHESVSNQTSSHHLYFDNLLESAIQLSQSKAMLETLANIKGVFTHLDALEDKLERMRKIAGNLNTDGLGNKNPSGQMGAQIRKAIFQVSQEVSSFFSLAKAIESHIRAMHYIFDQTIALAREVCVRIDNELKRAGKDVPDDWKSIIEELSDQKRALVMANTRGSWGR